MPSSETRKDVHRTQAQNLRDLTTDNLRGRYHVISGYEMLENNKDVAGETELNKE